MWCIWVFEEFWVTQNLGQSMLVTTPYCQWLLPLTNYGDQFQQWTLFILKQYCLEGILAKESSPRTKDFLLWRDLHSLKINPTWTWMDTILLCKTWTAIYLKISKFKHKSRMCICIIGWLCSAAKAFPLFPLSFVSLQKRNINFFH